MNDHPPDAAEPTKERDLVLPSRSSDVVGVRFAGAVYLSRSLGVFEVALVLAGLCFGVAAFVQPAHQQLPLLFVAGLTALWTTLKSLRRSEPVRGDFVFKEGALYTDRGAFLAGIPRGVFTCLSDRRSPRATLVLLDSRKPLLEIVLRSESEARDVARRLGLMEEAFVTGDDRPAGARFALTLLLSVLLAALVVPALAASAPGVTMLAVTVAVLVFVCLVGSQYTSARVGADGVYVRGSLENRFVSYGEVDGVSEFGPWVRLHLASRDVFISTPALPWSLHREAARKALAEQIGARLTRYRESDAPSSERTALDEGTFRSMETTLDDLATIAESPRVRPELRVRAAEAIRAHEGGRALAPRLRVAAHASASPSLSRALELAAQDEASPPSGPRAITSGR